MMGRMANLSSGLLAELATAMPLRRVDLGGGVVLRPLTRDDLDRLVEIFAGDPAMNWSLTSWQPSNVEFVLDVRLQHYARYGFGLYAVEYDGALAGWSGLQFEKQEHPQSPGELEVVSFIAREAWGHGITTRVWTWALDRVFDAGVQRVTSATRPENPGGEGVTVRMGFERDSKDLVEHWGFPAKHWTLTREKWRQMHPPTRSSRLASQVRRFFPRPTGRQPESALSRFRPRASWSAGKGRRANTS